MSDEPFIPAADRPDLTVDLDKRASEFTVRELAEILGNQESLFEDDNKRAKDNQDHKRTKDAKDAKDHKDSKDQKDSKEPKDGKDAKDSKDQKEQKDHKEHKEHKDQKDFGDTPKPVLEGKNVKDAKDQKDVTEKPFTSGKQSKDQKDAAEPKSVDVGPPAPEFRGELDELIRRVSGLEQALDSLKK